MFSAFWLYLIGKGCIPASNGLFEKWEKFLGTAIVTQISAKHSELWHVGLSPWKTIWQWEGSTWQEIPDQADSLSAAKDGWVWKVLDTKISRWNPDKIWESIPGGLEYINAYSKDSAIGVIQKGIWLWQGKNWQQLPANDARFAAIGDQDERWYVATDDKMYRWNHKKKNWDQIWGLAYHLDLDGPNRVVHTNSHGGIFPWDPATRYWDYDDSLVCNTTSIYEMGLIALTKAGEIFRRKL